MTDSSGLDSTVTELRKQSDMSEEEFNKVKDLPDEQVIKILMSRSKHAQIRNFFRPAGEIYAPIMYTADYFIKLVQKNGWGGHIVTLTTWDLMIIDIDLNFLLDDIVEHLDYHYPDDKFHIHRTNKGWHIYLLSRPVRHSTKEAINMRITCGCDPAHGTNSLYTGNSIRLTLKTDDKLDKASVYTGMCGKGEYNVRLKKVYDDIVRNIDKFSGYTTQTLMMDASFLAGLSQAFNDIPEDMGKLQILATSPARILTDGTFDINPSFITRNPVINMLYSKFLSSRKIKMEYKGLLEFKIREVIGYNNFYRIFESTPDYAFGVHTQDSLYFIVYRNLFMIDYDHKNRLKIVAEFCRYHPEYLFRCVKTPAGYHLFLTSHRIEYDHPNALELLTRLGSDNFHAITVKYRGYSVRVNQKHRYEKPYKESIVTYGKGTEDPELYALYKIHLDRYTQLCTNREQLYRIQKTVTTDMIKCFTGCETLHKTAPSP